MQEIKQDMPPSGGFSKVIYERIPLKNGWSLSVRCLAIVAVMGVGWYGYHLDKKRIMYEAIEKRAARFSFLPVIAAENDRIRLRNFLRLRKEEAELMKDVEGWVVGTYFGEPIYKSLKPNVWYEPHPMENWIQTDLKDFNYAHCLQISH